MNNETKSEIYAQGYEKWDGDRTHVIPPWFLIGQTALRNLVSSSGCLARIVFIMMFGFYYIGVFFVGLMHYQLSSLGKYPLMAPVAEIYDQLIQNTGLEVTEVLVHRVLILTPSLMFTLMAMLFYGSQLISKDKRANALQVYFSKAISRFDYVLGKYMAVAIITSTVTLVPSAMLILMGLVLAPDHTTFFAQAWYIPLITGIYWLLLTLSFGTITLAFSSFFSRGYMAAVGVVGFGFITTAFTGLVIALIGSSDMVGGFAWMVSVIKIGTALFKLEVSSWSELIWQIIDLSLICGAGVILIFRNIRPVEVVK